MVMVNPRPINFSFSSHRFSLLLLLPRATKIKQRNRSLKNTATATPSTGINENCFEDCTAHTQTPKPCVCVFPAENSLNSAEREPYTYMIKYRIHVVLDNLAQYSFETIYSSLSRPARQLNNYYPCYSLISPLLLLFADDGRVLIGR